MADEITYTAALQVTPSTGTNSMPKFGGTSKKATQTTPGVIAPQLATSTTPAAIPLTGLTAPRWARFENVDLTNNIQIGPYVSATFHPMFELKPGEACVGPLWPAVVLYAKAVAGTPKIVGQVLET